MSSTVPTRHLDDVAELRARAEQAEAALARVTALAIDMRTWQLGADPMRYSDAIAEAILEPGFYLPGAAIEALEKSHRRR